MTQSLTPLYGNAYVQYTYTCSSIQPFIHSFLVSFIAVLLLFCRVLCYTDTLKLSHYVYLTRERCPRISVPFPCACCICGNVLCVIKTWTVCGGMSQKSAPFNFPKTEIYMKNKLDNSVKDFSLFTGEFMYSEAEMLVETFFFFCPSHLWFCHASSSHNWPLTQDGKPCLPALCPASSLFLRWMFFGDLWG